MRVSIIPGRETIAPRMASVVAVYLDGQFVPHCFEADSDLGYVVVARGPDGERLEYDGKAVYRVLRGNVVIRWRSRTPKAG